MALVSDLWRFPVKSFGGERARRAFVGPFGLLGDRRLAVVDEAGGVVVARREHALLGFRAGCGDDEDPTDVRVTTPAGEVLAWSDPALAERLEEVLGRPARLVQSAVGVHDAAPIHVVSTGSLTEVGEWLGGEEVDWRRFRANLVLEPEDPAPFAEDAWVGAALQVGEDGPLLQVASPTERCAVTTFDPDTLERDNRVLAGLARRRENLFGLYARVLHAGWVEVGAPVTLVRAGIPLT